MRACVRLKGLLGDEKRGEQISKLEEAGVDEFGIEKFTLIGKL